MKVLIISFRYEPFNSIGANRVNSLVKYLKEHQNFEYKVITAYAAIHKNPYFKEDKNVSYYTWFDIFRLKKINYNKLDVGRESNGKISKTNSIIGKLKSNILNLLYQFVSFFGYPDPYVNWAYNVIKSADTLVNNYKPDIIISSSYPYSSHIPAYYFSKKYNIKWYAEMRDPWVNNHGLKRNIFHKYFDKKLSKFLFKKANSIITVSEVWKNDMSELYNKKVLLVRNGFELDKFKVEPSEKVKNLVKVISKKIILYTGSIFPENQDIKSFLTFFNKDSKLTSNYVFLYVGSGKKIIDDIILQNKIPTENVIIFDKVSLQDSLWLQEKAEFLLLLNWKHGSKGIIPGKFYEYLGSNKPILLWNNSVRNELYELSIALNYIDKYDKILILDNMEKSGERILNFKFNMNTSILYKFSRSYQFEKLIADVKK